MSSSKLLGGLVGVAIAGAAVYSVFFVEWSSEPIVEAPPIRPLKTMVIESTYANTGRKYPGRVRANQEVDLAFQVAGPLVELNVKNGQQVSKGDQLAKIDQREFQIALNSAEARLSEAKALWERMERLFNEGHAQQVEYEENKRSFGVAKADADQARKDLEDTVLTAPFDGLIASTLVENFQNVQAKEPILSLQDVASVEIEINVPEERVALNMNNRDKVKIIATFDYLPDREFEVTLKEFATEADPLTQTYAATLAMAAPKDVAILPGMTATVRTYLEAEPNSEEKVYAVPIDAVPVDGVGHYHVWKVKGGSGGTATVHRVDVKVGDMIQDQILVLEGLDKGDRIALAGVHLLREGQTVRPVEPKGDAGS